MFTFVKWLCLEHPVFLMSNHHNSGRSGDNGGQLGTFFVGCSNGVLVEIKLANNSFLITNFYHSLLYIRTERTSVNKFCYLN